MNKDSYDRFYNYLCEVVMYYKANKSLKNFSPIAKKWKVKAITKDLFYSFNLHTMRNGLLPSRELSDKIRNVMAKNDELSHKRTRYGDGDVVAWERNGYRSVAVMRSDGMFSICLNYRNRSDEENRLWEVDDLPRDVNIEKANMKDLKRLVNFLVKDCYKENLN